MTRVQILRNMFEYYLDVTYPEKILSRRLQFPTNAEQVRISKLEKAIEKNLQKIDSIISMRAEKEKDPWEEYPIKEKVMKKTVNAAEKLFKKHNLIFGEIQSLDKGKRFYYIVNGNTVFFRLKSNSEIEIKIVHDQDHTFEGIGCGKTVAKAYDFAMINLRKDIRSHAEEYFKDRLNEVNLF